MNTVRKLAIGVGALSALASTAHAQQTDPATASASASGAVAVIQPIALSKGADLNFGTIVKPLSGTATVALDSANGRTVTGTTAVNNAANPAKSASFTIQGEGGSAYSISVPGSFTMSNGSGGQLTVNTVNNAGGGGTLSGGIGSTASATFGVGGSINIDTGTASGAYNGTFTVTASYN